MGHPLGDPRPSGDLHGYLAKDAGRKESPSGAPVPEPQDLEAPEAEEVLRCVACGHEITSAAHRISVNGGHHHTFANPAGIVFEIGCFSEARGCANWGRPTEEFTWFKGYAWRFSICARCHAHLGWHYVGDGGFYGLILAHLI